MLFFLAIIAVASAAMESYENQQVLRILPKDESQLLVLQSLFRADYPHLDFWLEPSQVGRPVDIRVKEGAERFASSIERLGLNVTAWIPNLQELVDQQFAPQEGLDFFTAYHSYEEVTAWLQEVTSNYPNLATMVNIGSTYEGRTQWGIKLTSRTGSNKPVLLIDSAIHAREWITVATTTYWIDQLTSNYGKVNDVTVMLDTLEIIIVPIVNVDGYVWTWTRDRMWRKTRRPNPGSSCIGTDPNRNWDYHWGENGASGNPCSETFYGAAPFSEACVANLAKYMTSLGPNLKGYIAVHAYSQLWMTPWGWTTQLPPDFSLQNSLSIAATRALTAVYGTRYVTGPISTTIYPASGNAVDWAYGELGVVFSCTPELRDLGQYGFLLPPNQIKPSGIETSEAFRVFAQALYP